jgi:hypothetical protein
MNNQYGFLFRVVVVVFGTLIASRAAAQSTDIQQAYKAMEMARSYRAQGDLANAESMFRIALRSAPKESNVHKEAQDELDYYLPLIRIQGLLWDGEVQAAERELFALQQTVEDRPIRRQEINRIMSGLRSTATDTGHSGDATVDEKIVTRAVQTGLHSYYRQNNRYPTSRSSLVDVLPFDRPPLDSFVIERYSSSGTGYLLVLRDKKGAGQTLTLQNTGLLQPPGSP